MSNIAISEQPKVAPALVVGGTSGLGLAVTQRLLSTGYQVTTVGRSPAPDGVARHYLCDLGDSVAWQNTLSQVVAEHSHFEVTAFIAGFARAILPAAATPVDRQMHYRINVDYVADAYAAIAGLWKERASVFTIGTQWIYRSGCPWIIPYITAKHALWALTCEIAATSPKWRVRHYCVPTMATPAYTEVRRSFERLCLAKEFSQLGLETHLASPQPVANAIVQHLAGDVSTALLWRVCADYRVVPLADAHTAWSQK